jgi:ribosome-binding protein aMBF1 (putative translation factor)
MWSDVDATYSLSTYSHQDLHGRQVDLATRQGALRRFGRRVRTLRRERRLSQEALAARAGVHRTYVGSVERGERNVSVLNIHALAAALDVDPSDLLKEPPGSEDSSDLGSSATTKPDGK